jgi:hypothetical protein
MMARNGETGLPLVPAGADPPDSRARRLLRRLCLAAATGYIFLFFAERVFWAHWRDGTDDAGSFVATWIVYSIAGEICLVAIHDFRVRDLSAMFLIGALLGWLVEGVFSMTFFGTDDMAFPFTIAWTGLAWHALIVVVAGWYGLQTALLHSFRRTALTSAILGLFWGVWSVFWDASSPVGSAAFVAHAFLATLALVVAFRAFHACRSGRLRPSRLERACLAGVVLLYFLAVTVPRIGWIALVTLAPLFALIFLALRRNAAVEGRPHFLVAIDHEFPWRHTLPVLLMPAVASAIHEGCRMSGLYAPTNILVFAITLPLGVAGFVFSLWRIFKRPLADASFVRR